MAENIPFKFLFLLAFIYVIYLGYSTFTVNNMVELKNDCEKSSVDFLKFSSHQNSPEAKKAEEKMLATCKTMGQQGEIIMKSLAANKLR